MPDEQPEAAPDVPEPTSPEVIAQPEPQADPAPAAPPKLPSCIEITCPEESRAFTGPIVSGLFRRGAVLEVPGDVSPEAAGALIADGTATPH